MKKLWRKIKDLWQKIKENWYWLNHPNEAYQLDNDDEKSAYRRWLETPESVEVLGEKGHAEAVELLKKC